MIKTQHIMNKSR